jgi:hypothetical protein
MRMVSIGQSSQLDLDQRELYRECSTFATDNAISSHQLLWPTVEYIPYIHAAATIGESKRSHQTSKNYQR